ncbi:bifunctional protein GlmU-like isoform X3 [Mauremys reevesii]|uniref:bifunctional protein GlmU-like isoform X3 n=1 Tax=Mauremys reevesii TaxID=260615 RepID=UPI00193FD6C7|nr:bifunctional protein GlmU-like isoform X3 [Mauremys reevesii]XP_039384322.1 bifunctional protein GlmU-like isoform X3 [Mauremys reevesii]
MGSVKKSRLLKAKGLAHLECMLTYMCGHFKFHLPCLAGPSAFSVYALRLGPGEDIVTSLLQFVEDKKLKAPFVMTCVGSITKATLRLANATASNTNQIIHLNERFEIVSLVGTLNKAPHLHICLSDKDGKTVGGHVISDLEVFTTAEIVIGECTGLQFTREMDDRTGFPELVISSRSEKYASWTMSPEL